MTAISKRGSVAREVWKAVVFVGRERLFSVGFFCGWNCAIALNTFVVLYVFPLLRT